ncbi:MAG: ammonium transporter, partial [Phycisphaerae bacterium]
MTCVLSARRGGALLPIVAVLASLLLTAAAFAQSASLPPTATPGAASLDGVGAGVIVGQSNSGDTAWMLISAALVMLMIPGLALFYAGMVRRKNVLGTMMHSMAALPILGVAWVLIGYPLAFGTDHGSGLIGWDAGKVLFWNILPTHLHAGTQIPEYVFMIYQGMFAIITPALIAGAFAERVKFSAYSWFVLLWSAVVYYPLAHWVWGGGWMGPAAPGATAGIHLGAVDFAGGIVVHVSAGISALVMALYLGKRIGYPQHVLQPNSLVLTLLGAGLLWFGWFGFNGGLALAADSSAVLAFTNTQIAAAAGALSWMLAEWFKHRRPTSLGVASGLVAGLATITPCAGFVPPAAALLIGLAAGVICYGAVLAKAKMGYDDSLDAFGVHGVGGFIGALCVGIFARKLVGGPNGVDGALAGNGGQFTAQLLAAGATAVYAALATFVITVIIDKLIGFRTSEAEEIEGLDPAIHGEQGWMLEQMP